MKRFIAVILAVLMAVMLSGCCLKHDMQPATCTQPSTCSKCGKTEGEPLGHTPVDDPAKEPTCTETGLTAGSHCSVCGEVFEAQKEIPALGHDWVEATFSKPQTCRVCGATGEEALGSKLFIRALTGAPEAEPVMETIEKAEEEWKPVLKTIRLTGKSKGFDELDDMLAATNVVLTIDAPEKDQIALLGEAIVNGSKPIHLLLALDRENMRFTLPGIDETVYQTDYELLKETFAANGTDVSGVELMQQGFSGAVKEESEAMKNLALKYAEILFGVFDQENTTETEGSYQLELIGTTEECTILRSKPSAEDWETMLKKLYGAALSDPELEPLVRQAAQRSYSSAQMHDAGMELADYQDYMVEQFRESLAQAQNDAAETAAFLSQLGLEAAYRDGRLYGLRLGTMEADLVRYESSGELEDGRTDKLQIPVDDMPVLVTSTVRRENGKTTGRISVDGLGINLDYSSERDESGTLLFDYKFSGMGATAQLTQKKEGEDIRLKLSFNIMYIGSGELNILVADASEHIALPEGEAVVLATEEELEAALAEIGESFQNADVFGAAA